MRAFPSGRSPSPNIPDEAERQSLSRKETLPARRAMPKRWEMTQGRAILTVETLCKSYGDLKAVDGVSLKVSAGEIVGLLGPNGAGKTTTINMILGVLAPTAGSVEIDGVELALHRRRALSRTNFAAVYAPLPGNLTVEQNLRVFGMIYAVPDLAARIAEILDLFDLRKFRRTRAGLLSSGEQTRLTLAKAVLNRPRLLMLDEPTASIDPANAREIRASIAQLVDGGHCGVLWTSHNMYEVEAVCDRVLFLSHGRIVLEGDPKTLPGEHGVASLDDLFVAVAHDHPGEERTP
jgi:ABC-2 type transport system ATP-binding protein